ncbi:MAG: TonB-dependent receptor [Vicinamibacterales bacterium]
MATKKGRPSATSRQRQLSLLLTAAIVLVPGMTTAQSLTGALIGTVKDEAGGALSGAQVRISSPALIGGRAALTTNQKGQLRFAALPPGPYVLDIEFPGFTTYHEEDIRIGANATIERTAVLKLAGLAESLVVQGAGSRIEARDPGFGTRFGPEDLRAIPTRRSSMFDFIRVAPGISPTSPSNGTTTTVSAFGSGTNENQFLIDGTNFTCPCNGVARAEPGIDFIQEVQVESVGASAEFGNAQGAVINVVTRQGSERFLYDASYYGQTAGLTSQPIRLSIPGSGQRESGYERAGYRDLTTNLGGPAVRDRLWFFTGYQRVRDYDSQPGTDPNLPRTYEQDKIFAKLTWKLAPNWRLVQSFHDEFWVSPEQPTLVRPFEATLRAHASVPAVTFGHLTHTLSANTLWDVRLGRFVYSRADDPSTGIRTTPGRSDSVTGVSSGAPQQFSALTLIRTTAKATITHYRPGLLGADHEFKTGVQVERGEHRSPSIIPTGVRFVDSNGQMSQSISSAPSNSGGVFIAAAGFVSDALTLGDRLTINAGLRFDRSRAISQDLHTVDLEGRETDDIVRGLGSLYTWNVLSPRLGVTTKLTADGRTILRASYGRFYQGVLTGELGLFHPGVAPVSTNAFNPATGDYTRLVSVVDNKINLQLNREMRAPRSDEFSIGVDREVGHRLAVAIAYVRKDGRDFIGWTDVGGRYRKEERTLIDGRRVPVSVLENSTSARRFLLTNQEAYSLTYNGLVMVVEKRRSHGWQAFGSYTLSRAYGLLPSSGTTAAGTQVSTVAPPPPPQGITFGRDPNDLTNARGRLPNDRPHMFRTMASFDVPRTGIVLAANLQYFTGKPWAATSQVLLPQNPQQRIQLEPRGARRLSSQSLLDVRVSKTIFLGGIGRVELLVDVLNALNDTAEESLATDNLFSPNFGQRTAFVDPRRAMVSIRLNLGR